MDWEELSRVVSQMVRQGSVQAAKLRWEMRLGRRPGIRCNGGNYGLAVRGGTLELPGFHAGS
jgi:hypothetical protein